MNPVEASDVWRYFGDKPALQNLDLVVEEGGVSGLIGANGAGKTTFFRIVATLLRPSRGKVHVFGKDVVKQPGEVRKMISYLPEEGGVYRHLTGLEFLRMVARLHGVGEEAVRKGVEISGLEDSVKRKMGEYSKGMRRRILLASCLMVNPPLAVLDEPTAGLDVEHSVYVRKIIKEFAAKGTTFLVSSHNMLEVEYLCDEIALIDKGRIVEQGKPSQLLQQYMVENLEELFVKKVVSTR
ncbi:MAG: ABC transporter ATP-binding protein [Candidatus Caldarchaeum sp.]|uniref:ABC transporter ATP-binding protein n=1 Tax=Caldiarchaeum subterraneum TaxID=311458 RepID=A0A7C5U4A1_CALS0